MIKPYSQKSLSDEEYFTTVYVVQDTFRRPFGIYLLIVGEFSVNHSYLVQIKLKMVTYVALTLHNFLRSESSSGNVYIPPQLLSRGQMVLLLQLHVRSMSS